MKIGINPVYGRFMAYSIIPLLLIIAGTYGGIFLLSDSLSVDLNDEFESDLINHHNSITFQQAANLNATLNRLDSQLNVLNAEVNRLILDPPETEKDSYFHDISQDKLTPQPQFSEKYNLTIDLSVSSYFVFPVESFSNYSSSLNFTISTSSFLDFTFISLYPTIDDLLWIDVYYNSSGLERSYPFNGPKDADYSPLNASLTQSLLASNSSEIKYSSPYLDPRTGTPVMSVGKLIQIDNENQVVIKFTLGLNQIFADIKNLADQAGSSFLVDESFNTIVHSSMRGPASILNSTQQLSPIDQFEGGNSSLITLLGTAVQDQISYEIINYGDELGSQIVSITKVKNFIFGLVEQAPDSDVLGTLNFLEFVIIPVAVILSFLGLMGILLRRYGFLRNVGIETLVKLEQSVTSKIEKVSKLEEQDVSELIQDEIKEKGEELRESSEEIFDENLDQIKDQLANVDKKIVAKINEQLNAFEGKLVKALDNKLENIDQFVQHSKGKINLSGDQLRSLLDDPAGYIQEQANIFNIENLSSLQDIANLPNDVNRTTAIFTQLDSVDAQEFSSIIKKDPEEVIQIVNVIPEEYGINMDGDQIILENEKIKPNILHVLQIFYQINLDDQMSKANPSDNSETSNQGASSTSDSQDPQ